MATDTRERLVRAARDLIHGSSFADVGVEDICARAGVHRGSLYHFFDSKQALGLAVVEANWAVMTALLDETFRPDVAPLERIDRFTQGFGEMLARAQTELGSTPGCPLGNLAAEMSAHGGDAQARIAGAFEVWTRYAADAIRQAQVRGEADPGLAPDEAALQVLACVQGFALLAKVYDRPALMEQARAAVRQLLRPTAPASSGDA